MEKGVQDFCYELSVNRKQSCAAVATLTACWAGRDESGATPGALVVLNKTESLRQVCRVAQAWPNGVALPHLLPGGEEMNCIRC